MILLLLFLILIPIFVYKWAKTHRPTYKYTYLGFSFGIIVAPFSLGLYGTFFIPFIGLPTGLLGLLMTMLHGSIGWKVCLFFELITPMNMSMDDHIILDIVNGIVWSVIYSIVGFSIDMYRRNTKQNPNKL